MWKHLVLKGGRKKEKMQIQFEFTPQQKEMWEKLPEVCSKRFSVEIAAKIANSLNTATGNTAVIDNTEGMPISFGTINRLTYPVHKKGYYVTI